MPGSPHAVRRYELPATKPPVPDCLPLSGKSSDREAMGLQERRAGMFLEQIHAPDIAAQRVQTLMAADLR